jgi:hypothetical protein
MDVLREAALWALEHFAAMDQANAKIHCAPVRYSPITFRLSRALTETWPVNEGVPPVMIDVRMHDGQYEEDKGR